MVRTMTLEWFWLRVQWSAISLDYLGTQCRQHRLGYKGTGSDSGGEKQRWKGIATPRCACGIETVMGLLLSWNKSGQIFSVAS